VIPVRFGDGREERPRLIGLPLAAVDGEAQHELVVPCETDDRPLDPRLVAGREAGEVRGECPARIGQPPPQDVGERERRLGLPLSVCLSCLSVASGRASSGSSRSSSSPRSAFAARSMYSSRKRFSVVAPRSAPATRPGAGRCRLMTTAHPQLGGLLPSTIRQPVQSLTISGLPKSEDISRSQVLPPHAYTYSRKSTGSSVCFRGAAVVARFSLEAASAGRM
jgi:hypothetical protein